MKIRIALSIVLLLSAATLAKSKYSGGTGEPNDPYRIATPNDLYELRNGGGDSYFKMIDDINMMGFYETHPLFIISGAFSGVFDGNGHSISNFCGTEGLFEMTVGEDSVVKNLALIDVNMIGDQPGGLVRANNGIIFNCSVTGRVTGDYCVGGLAGWSIGLVEGCSANCIVDGNTAVSGLVGMNKGDVNNCSARGSVSGDRNVGGIAGDCGEGKISNSYSTCYVEGNRNIGGLAGGISIEVVNCYAAGVVDGNENSGAFIGASSIHAASYSSCFFDNSINPDMNGIGSGNVADPNVIGLPTSELQKRRTFADAEWDMVNVWDVGENQTYPFLRVHLPSDINKDDQTNLYDLAILAENWLGKW